MLKKIDYSDFLTQAKQDNDFNYLLEKYDISEETQKKCGIGFVKEWKSPLDDKDDTTPPLPCCIIPRSKSNYVAINTTPIGFEKKEIGKTDFFNVKNALKSPTPFIVMNEIAAMSIIEAGGKAMALCKETEFIELIRLLEREFSREDRCAILMFNDTDNGRKFQEKIEQLINSDYKSVNYITAVTNRKKRPESINDMLKRKRVVLEALVETNILKAREKIKAVDIPRPSSGMSITEWLRDTERPPEILIKTGFDKLDETLKGGLTTGLHFIGAAPGTGKTALCLQMADQMAQMGTEVLFFSLEMSKYELGARSVSRHTYRDNGLKKIKNKSEKMGYIAKSALEVRNSGFYPEYTRQEMDAISAGIDKYEQYATHIHFYERDLIYKKACPVETMIAAIDEFAKRYKKFIVFIDYLQLIAHQSNGDGERQAVENAVYALKAASLKHNIPIMAISSVNRGSYLDPITMQSFKESGAVEFTASSLFGLQYKGADYTDTDINPQKRKVRIDKLEKEIFAAKKDAGKDIQLQLKIIKARDGCQEDLTFNAKLGFNYFEVSEWFNSAENIDYDEDEEETIV